MNLLKKSKHGDRIKAEFVVQFVNGRYLTSTKPVAITWRASSTKGATKASLAANTGDIAWNETITLSTKLSVDSKTKQIEDSHLVVQLIEKDQGKDRKLGKTLVNLAQYAQHGRESRAEVLVGKGKEKKALIVLSIRCLWKSVNGRPVLIGTSGERALVAGQEVYLKSLEESETPVDDASSVAADDLSERSSLASSSEEEKDDETEGSEVSSLSSSAAPSDNAGARTSGWWESEELTGIDVPVHSAPGGTSAPAPAAPEKHSRRASAIITDLLTGRDKDKKSKEKKEKKHKAEKKEKEKKQLRRSASTMALAAASVSGESVPTPAATLAVPASLSTPPSGSAPSSPASDQKIKRSSSLLSLISGSAGKKEKKEKKDKNKKEEKESKEPQQQQPSSAEDQQRELRRERPDAEAVQAALRRAEAMAEAERKQRDAIDAELRTQRLTSVDLRARLDQQERLHEEAVHAKQRMEEQLANAQERLEQERARAQQLEKDVTQLREQLDAARMQHQAQLKGLQEQLEHEHAHAARLEEELQKLEKERNESRMRGEDKSASKDEKKRQKKQSKKHSALAPAPPAGGEATTPVVPTFPPALLADFQREREAAKTELQQAREQLSQEQAVAQQRLEQAEKDRIEANQRLEKEIAQRDAAERAREEAEEARRQLGVLLEKERQEHASLRQQHASLTEQARSLQLQAQENALKLQTAEDRLRELQLELEKVRKQREDAPPPPPTFPQELIEKHKTDIRELQEQLATERALAISLQERLNQVARARTQEEQVLAQEKHARESAMAECEREREARTLVEIQLAEASKALEAALEAQKRDETTREELEKQLAEVRKQLEKEKKEARRREKDLNRQLEELRRQLEDLRTREARRKEEEAKKVAEEKGLQEDVRRKEEQQRRQIEEARKREAELEDARRREEEARRRLETELVKLREQEEAARKREEEARGRLEKEVEEARRREQETRNRLEKELNELRKEARAIAEKEAEAARCISQLEQELENEKKKRLESSQQQQHKEEDTEGKVIIDDSSMGSEEEEECKRVPVRLLAQYQEQIEEETRKRRRLEEENLRLEREKLQLEADYRSALARSASGAPDALQGLQRSSLEEQAHRLQRELEQTAVVRRLVLETGYGMVKLGPYPLVPASAPELAHALLDRNAFDFTSPSDGRLLLFPRVLQALRALTRRAHRDRFGGAYWLSTACYLAHLLAKEGLFAYDPRQAGVLPMPDPLESSVADLLADGELRELRSEAEAEALLKGTVRHAFMRLVEAARGQLEPLAAAALLQPQRGGGEAPILGRAAGPAGRDASEGALARLLVLLGEWQAAARDAGLFANVWAQLGLAILSGLDAAVVNALVARGELCRAAQGFQFKLAASRLAEWARQAALPGPHEPAALLPLASQAANFLLLDKSAALATEAAVRAAFPDLPSAHLARLAEQFAPDDLCPTPISPALQALLQTMRSRQSPAPSLRIEPPVVPLRFRDASQHW